MKSPCGRMPLGMILILILSASTIFADVWDRPQARAVFSQNGRFCLVVVPSGDTLVPGDVDESVPVQHLQELLPHKGAFGALYEQAADSTFEPIWARPLDHDVVPYDVLVHNGGRWVVTFDTWHFLGNTDRAVVILDSTGAEVERFAVEDLLPSGKVSRLARSTSSRWWRCGARFVDSTDQLVLATVSNGEMPVFSEMGICDDYVYVNLATGIVDSFVSNFDDVLESYSQPCYDHHLCPTVRCIYYHINNPGSDIIDKLNDLSISGGPFDTLRAVHEEFSGLYVWSLGAALTAIGHRAHLICEPFGTDYFALLVEIPHDLLESTSRDSLPVIVMLPDSTLTFPLTHRKIDFAEARLTGADMVVSFSYRVKTGEDGGVRRFPKGGLSEVHEVDTSYWRRTNIFIQEIEFGTHLFIDYSEDLVRR